ncbi:MAG: SGNH/GDSL hydrolase family protein [Bacteroides sp.]|nr:SGNH/GDSL hydrolase family protein [Bacteroides sp.]
MKLKYHFLHFVLFIIIILLMGIYHIEKRISLATRNKTLYYQKIPKDTILSIGIIGDSWAYNSHTYNMELFIDSILTQNKIYSHIVTRGKKGAKSKDLYQFLTDSNNHQHNINNQFDYCIIYIGINDLHGQYGATYYIHHTSLIINHLLKRNIKPILIEIPYFYNESQYDKYPFWKIFCYRMLSLYTNRNFDLDNLNLYRRKMEIYMNDNFINNNIIYIKTDTILKHNPSFYTDDMHINELGYKALYTNILKEILIDIKKYK